MAVANYHAAHGQYPPAFLADAEGRPAHSWRILILPYLEQHHIYNAYNFDEPWDGPNNRLLADPIPPPYVSHALRREGRTETNYLAVVGPETAWPGAEGLTDDRLTDDPGSTILAVENFGAGIHWMEPRDLSFEAFDPTLDSPGGIGSPYTRPAIVTVNGRVLRLDRGITPETIRAMLTASGGEPVRQTKGGWAVIPDGRDRPLATPPDDR